MLARARGLRCPAPCGLLSWAVRAACLPFRPAAEGCQRLRKQMTRSKGRSPIEHMYRWVGGRQVASEI